MQWQAAEQQCNGREKDWIGQPRNQEGEGSDPGGAATTAVCGQSPRLHVLPARQAAPVWRGRPTQEQEAGVEGEGGNTGELSQKQFVKYSANSCFVCLYFFIK